MRRKRGESVERRRDKEGRISREEKRGEGKG